jgi:hypothetical protein
MKIAIISIGLYLLWYHATCQTITGPIEVEIEMNTNYGYVDGISGATYSWNYTGDYTIINQSSDSLEIKWNSEGVNMIQLYSSGTYLEDELIVTVGNPLAIEFAYDLSGNRITREVVTLGPVGGLKSLVNEEEIINEIEQQEFRKFQVYPNPATQCVFVSLNDAALEVPERLIIVYDYLGKEMLSLKAFDEVTQVDLSSFNSGIYILRLVYGNSSRECKIIKQ